jgi:hypothetical protein
MKRNNTEERGQCVFEHVRGENIRPNQGKRQPKGAAREQVHEGRFSQAKCNSHAQQPDLLRLLRPTPGLDP